ncbi:MAG TPA: dihydrofolate reductase family protein [Dermatophilaceae bacterium]
MGSTRLSVFIASSLDGYIATRDGSLAWLEEAARGDEDYGYDFFLESVDALAMGRGTYDHIAHLDPLPFGGRRVFVFTHHPPPHREGVTFWQESPRRAWERWSAMGLARVYVDGGAVISEFLEQGLIDDLVITKVPILLGDGLPLFHPIPVSAELRLEGVRHWPSGLVNLAYSRVKQASPTRG